MNCIEWRPLNRFLSDVQLLRSKHWPGPAICFAVLAEKGIFTGGRVPYDFVGHRHP